MELWNTLVPIHNLKESLGITRNHLKAIKCNKKHIKIYKNS